MYYWACLVGAGVCECVWAIGMKYTCGFTHFWPSVITLAAMPSSMYLLSLSLKALPIGTAYAVWTGIGAVATAIMGMVLFREPATVARIVCILLIVVGIVGLALLEKSQAVVPSA